MTRRHEAAQIESTLGTVLTKLRRRLWLQRLLHGAAWFLAVTLVGLLTAGFVPSSAALRPGSLAAALGLVFLLGLMWRWQRSPLGLHQVARMADARMGLEDRLSTALETPPDRSEVAAALGRDAAAHAARVRLDVVAPWSWPSRALITVGVTGAAMLFMATMPSDWRAGLWPGTSAAGVDSLLDAGALSTLADIVQADADRYQDPYLAAVADALAALAEAVGDDRDAREHAEELGAVLDHLARAYGSDMSGAELAAQLMSPERAAAASLASSRSAPGDSLDDEELYRLLNPDFDAAVSAAGVSEEGAAPRPEGEPGQLAGAAPQRDMEGGVALEQGIDTAFATQFEGPAGEGPTAGDLIGAAEEAGAGDSQLAGHGSPALDGPQEVVSQSFSSLDFLALAGKERDEGRRIDVRLPPGEGDLENVAARVEVGPWTAGREAALDSDAAAPWHRTIVGRYFLPSQTLRGADER